MISRLFSWRGSRRFVLAALAALLAAVVFAAGCDPGQSGSGSGTSGTNGSSSPKVTNFSTQTIMGTSINFSDLWGKPIVLNFGASWCGPCQDEAPVLARMYEKYKDRANFMGMAVKDTVDDQRAFARDKGLTYTIGMDPNGDTLYNFQQIAKVPYSGIPTTFFIDRNGYIVSFYVGPISEATFDQRIAMILN